MKLWQLAAVVIALLYFFWTILNLHKTRTRLQNEEKRESRRQRDIVKRRIRGKNADIIKEIDDSLE